MSFSFCASVWFAELQKAILIETVADGALPAWSSCQARNFDNANIINPTIQAQESYPTLVVTSATLVATGALLVVTKKLLELL